MDLHWGVNVLAEILFVGSTKLSDFLVQSLHALADLVQVHAAIISFAGHHEVEGCSHHHEEVANGPH